MQKNTFFDIFVVDSGVTYCPGKIAPHYMEKQKIVLGNLSNNLQFHLILYTAKPGSKWCLIFSSFCSIGRSILPENIHNFKNYTGLSKNSNEMLHYIFRMRETYIILGLKHRFLQISFGFWKTNF